MTDPVDLGKQIADATKAIGDLQTAANIVWTLVTGFLVMFMQLGFALLETGLTRAKKCHPYDGHEHLRLCDWNIVSLLAMWVCFPDGWRRRSRQPSATTRRSRANSR